MADKVTTIKEAMQFGKFTPHKPAPVCVTFTYEGESRTVEPFLLGISTADNLVLRCREVVDGERVWKLFLIDEMESVVKDSSRPFNPDRASEYVPDDKDVHSPKARFIKSNGRLVYEEKG